MYQRDAPVDTLDLHLPCSCLVHPNQHHPCCHWCIHSPVPPPIPTTSPPPPRKEQLWPYIREFSDNALTHVCKTLTKLAAAGEACELYDIHGHYADAGEAAALMSYTLGVDMVLTGHSLGRNKLDHLLKSGGWGWSKQAGREGGVSRSFQGTAGPHAQSLVGRGLKAQTGGW
jgi:hypothetical protein